MWRRVAYNLSIAFFMYYQNTERKFKSAKLLLIRALETISDYAYALPRDQSQYRSQ